MHWLTCFILSFCLWSVGRCQFDAFLDTDPSVLADDDTVREKWRVMESRIRTLAEEAVGMILPSATDIIGSLNISRSCFRDCAKLFFGLRKLNTWAVKFLDATTKSADGLLNIQVPSLGSYDECVDNKVFSGRSGGTKGRLLFQGKYCNLHVRPYLKTDKMASLFKSDVNIFENVYPEESVFSEIAKVAVYTYSSPVKAGLCIPSGCSTDDVNAMLQQVSDYVGVSVKAVRCAIKEETEYTPLMVGIMTVYSLAGFLVLLGTIMDLCSHYFKKEFGSSIIYQILKAFSFISNFKKLTSASPSLNTGCLNGMRFLSVTWVILGHTYMYVGFINHNFPRNFEEIYRGNLAFQVVINGGFSVDTFFFLSGFLVCYVTTKLVKIQKKPFNLKMYIIHRLWRIIPAYAFVIGYEFLKPLAGSGPLFHEIALSDLEHCKNNWWTNFLFINNFYHQDKICVPHSWFIAVDMQLYLFALVILLPLMRWPKVGISLAGVTIVVSMVVTALMCYKHNILAVFIMSEGHKELNTYHHYHNMNPYLHAPPFCIGLLLGYLLATRSNFKVSKIMQVVGWCASIAMCLAVIYGVQKWNIGSRPTFWENMTYSAFCRVAWSLGIAWMTFCCCTGHGGVINYILSWKMWIPLSKLTYIAYLVHISVMLSYSGNMRNIAYFEHYIVVWMFIGHLAIIFGVAFAGFMLVEAPFLSLEKVLLQKSQEERILPPPKESAQSEKDLEKGGEIKENGFQRNTEIPNGEFTYI